MIAKIVRQFVYTLRSRSFYREVAQEWRGVCLGYLLLLVALTTLPTVLEMHLDLGRYMRDEAPYITEQIPTVTVKNGEIDIDKESPYDIKGKTGEVLAIFDTRADSRVLSEGKAPVIVARKRFAITGRNQQTRLVDAGSFGDFIVDKTKVDRWEHIAARWLAPALFPILLIVFYVVRIVQVVIYATLGMLYAKVRKLPLDFPALMRVSTMAVTPVILVNTVLALLKLRPPFWTLLSIAAVLINLGFAIHAASVKKEVNVVA